MILTISIGIPHALNSCHRLSLCMQSNDFSMSIKLTVCYSEHCLMMLRRVNIWSVVLCIWIPSVHPDSLQNPAGSFLRASSTASVICQTIILHRILLSTDRRVIPCQLLQLLNAPFFGIPIIMSLFHSSGIIPYPSPNCCENMGQDGGCFLSGSALNSSAFRLSCPRGFTILQDFMAAVITCLVGISTLMSRSS